MTLPPCADNPQLWESTDPLAHAFARRTCLDQCDAHDWCRDQFQQALALVPQSSHEGPQGTWAGELYGKCSKRRTVRHGTEVRYWRHLADGEEPCAYCKRVVKDAWRSIRPEQMRTA
jgi:hypothetical protein